MMTFLDDAVLERTALSCNFALDLLYDKADVHREKTRDYANESMCDFLLFLFSAENQRLLSWLNRLVDSALFTLYFSIVVFLKFYWNFILYAIGSFDTTVQLDIDNIIRTTRVFPFVIFFPTSVDSQPFVNFALWSSECVDL